MAYRKASEENAAVALGSTDFWAAVQNGGDVRISVADILTYLRGVLKTGDIAELPGKLQGISDTAAGNLSDAVMQIDALIDALQADVDTALGQLDGSVSDKLTALQADVNTRVLKSQLGGAQGQIPVLGAGGKLDVATIPAVAITDTFPVASQTEMLALTAERGDIAIRSDLNKCFVLKTEPATTLANWKELLTPTDAVLSVAGLKGAITASGLKAALAIAITDVSGLKAALDALTAADTAETKARQDADTAEASARASADASIRTDFAAADATEAKARADADASIRADFAAADATKANLAGGTFTGTVSVRSSGAVGFVNLVSGAADRTGYTEFTGADGKRQGYIGYGQGTTLDVYAEAGVRYNFNAVPTINGQGVWYPGNFDPGTKADKAGATPTGQFTFKASATGTIASRGGDGSLLQVRADDGQGAAAMTFHRASSYATWFGLDTDNEFKFGGWSEGASVYRFWTSKNFNPDTKATLNASARFAALSSGNFQIDAASLNGGRITFDASATTLRIYEAGSPYRGISVDFAGCGAQSSLWHSGNFNPATKASLGAAVRFAGVSLGNSEGYIYGDDNANNVVVRTGTASTGYKYAFWDSAGFFTSGRGARFGGDVYTNGRFIVGEGQPASYIEMRDTDEGTRYVHNNSGNIGFLGSDAAWKMRTNDNGEIWCAQLGDLNTRIEDRASAWANAAAGSRVLKSGDEMTGDLSIRKAYPTVTMHYPNVKIWQMQVRENGWLYFPEDNGATFPFAITPGGNIYSSAWGGYLTNYVNATASSAASGRVAKTGDTMSGDLIIAKEYPNVTFLWGGLLRAAWQLRENGRLYYINMDNGDGYFSIGTDGSIITKQIGDLNTRIETRAADFANDRASRITSRLAYAGDQAMGSRDLIEPYGGAVVTGHAGNTGNGYTTNLRYRYLQMRDVNMNWYTIGYA